MWFGIRRLVGVTVAAAVGVALGGCDVARAPLDADCRAPDGTHVVDEQHRFAICLPESWRDLRPGDPGWAEIYGGPDTEVEQDVANGSLVRFVVPLRPRDADRAVHLAVYVEAPVAGWSVDRFAEAYVQQLGEAGDSELTSAAVELPAGRAIEITGTTPNTISDPPGIDFVDAFVIDSGDTVFYLVFSSGQGSRATYEDRFQEYASTFTRVTDQDRPPETTSTP